MPSRIMSFRRSSDKGGIVFSELDGCQGVDQLTLLILLRWSAVVLAPKKNLKTELDRPTRFWWLMEFLFWVIAQVLVGLCSSDTT